MVGPVNSTQELLPPLREELHCAAGPRDADGAPTWTLHDPANNRFFRLGWVDFEILSRWGLRQAAAIVQAINAQTTLQVDAERVAMLGQFLVVNNLLRLQGDGGIQLLRKQAGLQQLSWQQWLLHNYLFFRIPLLKPDRLLGWLYPRVAWIYSRGFGLFICGCALLALFLISRQWERFITTFSYFFNWSGLLQYGAALAAAKILHEFGHALTAHRYGCRVPSMGVAFMVMYPVLYTDASETWKLQNRRQRLAVAGAGMAAELGLAMVAALAWCFLTDGPLRSGAFLLATSTWIITLMVNVSPFMRFDGYYLLADWLGIDNLQPRSFAYARWHLRRLLFGCQEVAPERLAPRMQRIFVAYAWATWLYRVVLFLGIALLVYHFFFKLLGIVLLLVEVGWFIVRPILAEMRNWKSLPAATWSNPRSRLSLSLAMGFLVLLLIPWQGHVTAPALMKAERYAEIYLPRPGRLDVWQLQTGSWVRQGELLAALSSSELDFQAQHSALERGMVDRQLAYHGLEQRLATRRRIWLKELESASSKQAGYQLQRQQLEMRAPFAGVVLDLNDTVQAGQWLAEGQALMIVADLDSQLIEVYLEEADLQQAAGATAAVFYPEDPDLPGIACTVQAIEQGNSARIPALLASANGGEIAARIDAQQQYVPEAAVYRMLLRPRADAAMPSMVHPVVLRGSVRLDTPAISPIEKIWNRIVTVLIRESGF